MSEMATNMKTIDVSTRKYPNKICLVDDENYEWLNQWKWTAAKKRYTFYAVRKVVLSDGKSKLIFMHRLILGLENGDKIKTDHKNHNGLDNQIDNIRKCTNQQNLYNMNSNKNSRSIYKGIYWHKQNHNWCAHIKVDGKSKHIGCYDSEEEAAKAYDDAARKYYGDFANFNFTENKSICVL